MIAYICEQGAKIRREGERLLVCGKEGEKILYSHQLEKLILLGNIHMTAQARSLLLKKKIPTLFMSSSGIYRGRLEIDEGENVFLRKRQYELLSNADFQLSVAKEIVKAKLHNQGVMLSRIKKEHHLPEASHGQEQLQDLHAEAEGAGSVESLRGVEGAGAEIYFKHYAKAFNEELGFVKRARRPPTDPVNAVLSLLYTLLIQHCHTACRIAGLDPYPGNLHSLEYGRHALPLDLVEEFRAIFADALALALFNKHILKKEDFIRSSDPQTENISPKAYQGLRLSLEAMKKLLAAFASKLEHSFMHPSLTKGLSYSESIKRQAYQYRLLIEKKEEKYVPLLWQ